MNNKNLLARKRNKSRSKSRFSSAQNINSSSPMFQVNGFNILELVYTESIEKNFSSKDDEFPTNNIIELKEENTNNQAINENNSEAIEMTKTKAKNIEEYFTSKSGIMKIKENCLKCLMTDFLSNELLYFNSRKDLFNYIKYCFSTKNKLLFTNEEILKENKEKFMNANTSFVNGWRFFIPKTICKSCFMEIINMKNLISKIKNIFSDTERDSLCRTNYRNYALFSPRFRAAFSLRTKSRYSRRQSKKNVGNDKNKTNIENNSTKEEKAKIYNLNTKYDEIKKIIIIDKKILDDSVIEMIKNNTLNKNENIKGKKNINNNKITNSNKKNLKENETNISNNSNSININLFDDYKSNFDNSGFSSSKNNIVFNGYNNINITNNININNNLNKENSNFKTISYINKYIKELLNEMYFYLQMFYKKLDEIKGLIQLINDYIRASKQKLIQFMIIPSLLEFNKLYSTYKALYCSFDEKRICLYKYLGIIKNISEKLINVLNSFINEIKKNNININEKEKNGLISALQDLKCSVEDNKDSLEKYDIAFNNFKYNYFVLLNITEEIQSRPFILK